MPNFKKNTSPAMKRSAYKMKGYSYPGISPVKNDNLSDKHKKPKNLMQDPDIDSGSQNEADTSGYQQFVSVQNLKDANAPKDVIQKEYNKQMELFKQRKNT